MTGWFDPLTGRQLQPPGRPAGPQGVLGDPYATGEPWDSPNSDAYGEILWPLPSFDPDEPIYDPYADWDRRPDFGWDYGPNGPDVTAVEHPDTPPHPSDDHPYTRPYPSGDREPETGWEPDDPDHAGDTPDDGSGP
ncbi:hypothetical protein [Mycobacterium sp. E787]|uniref:hypothetical protein n=1 Tax=Mycobacterium sp. E787 TaxID=1834150 RepID=UPI0007FEAE4E|nr:hypothetical protein [Mycobacterium sp. E787]OBI53592.1 hypothetical protein A5705_02965 [Mycobacterium sp. E787]